MSTNSSILHLTFSLAWTYLVLESFHMVNIGSLSSPNTMHSFSFILHIKQILALYNT